MGYMTEGELNASSGVKAEAAAASIMYELDFATGELKWNDALYSIMHYPRTESLNRMEWWIDHIHPEDAMIINQAMDKLNDAKVPNWTVEYRFRAGDGEYVYVRDRASIIRERDGRPTKLIGTLSLNPNASRGIAQDTP